MKRFNILLIGLVLLLGITLPAIGQTILTNTTLSAAVSDSKTQIVVVGSATGINAPLASDPTKATLLQIDREQMFVKSVNGTTLTVIRGSGGTAAAAHVSGEFVFVIPAYLSAQFKPLPQGSCTRANELVLPRVSSVLGIVSDCIGGQWQSADIVQATVTLNNLLRLPDPGATALTALETAGTAPSAATEQYCTELDVPYPMVLTGMAVLNGTTVGTDKHLYILYDSSGKILANTAVAGTTTSGASTYQKINFTAKYFAVGPARYFGCTQTNGTTDTIRHAITAVNDNVLGGAVTTQVFGTVAAVTLPTTFTTAKAPYMAVF